MARKPHVGGQSSHATTFVAHMNPVIPSPTLIFTVTLSCRLILNLRSTDARLGVRMYSGGIRRTPGPSSDIARNRILPMHAGEMAAGIDNVVTPIKFEWMVDVEESSRRVSR